MSLLSADNMLRHTDEHAIDVFLRNRVLCVLPFLRVHCLPRIYTLDLIFHISLIARGVARSCLVHRSRKVGEWWKQGDKNGTTAG